MSTRFRGALCRSHRASVKRCQLHLCGALLMNPRWQSGGASAADISGVTTVLTNTVTEKTVAPARVWELWNEGNLFSLSVAQMRAFLASEGVPLGDAEGGIRKAVVVRRLEEHLHAKDRDAEGRSPSPGQQQQQRQQGREAGAYGARWSASGAQPETLLDLAQAGFYDGAANMAPKAFQVLADGSSADLVISRVNTAAFPGAPANLECYTLVSSDADSAVRARFSKALQWCFLNMSNLQMDGELTVSLGKLLLNPEACKYNEDVVSAYTLQQRLQLNHPYTWVSAVPDGAVSAAEAFMKEEGFALVGRRAALTYEATIKRASERLCAELDDNTRLVSLQREWVNVHTVYHTRNSGPDVCLLLRSRPPVPQQEVRVFSSFPIIELANDDVSDVLPPEHGQLTYLSENETRHFERVSDNGVAITIKEVKRQPLIVLHDEEEDARVEYSISVVIPASTAGSSRGTMNVRAIGLEVFELANRFARVVTEEFDSGFGMARPPSE